MCFTSYQNKNFLLLYLQSWENSLKRNSRTVQSLIASFQNNELPSEIFLITLTIFHYNFKISEGFLLGLCWRCKFQLHESKPFSLQVFEKPFSRNHCFLKSRSSVDHRKTGEFQEPQYYFNIFNKNYNLL